MNGDRVIHIRYPQERTKGGRNINSLLKCCHLPFDFGTTRSLCSIGSWKFPSVAQNHEYVSSSIIIELNENTERENRRSGREDMRNRRKKEKRMTIIRKKELRIHIIFFVGMCPFI